MDDKPAQSSFERATIAFYSDRSAGAREERAALLYALLGPLQGQSFGLDWEVVSIGRSPTNTICIPSDAVSRLHCEVLRSRAGRYSVLDSGSMNGTVLNGRQLEPEQELPLTHGDNISVCDSMFLFFHPQLGATDEAGAKIEIDVAAATAEAEGLLARCQELKELRRGTRRDGG